MLCPELPPRIYESLKTLCCLAAANRPLQAHEVAVAASLPPAQTAKILQQMAWAGFVESRRGAKGGFWLQKPATFMLTVAADSAFTTLTGSTTVTVFQQPGTELWGMTTITNGSTVHARGLLFLDAGTYKLVAGRMMAP